MNHNEFPDWEVVSPYDLPDWPLPDRDGFGWKFYGGLATMIVAILLAIWLLANVINFVFERKPLEDVLPARPYYDNPNQVNIPERMNGNA